MSLIFYVQRKYFLLSKNYFFSFFYKYIHIIDTNVETELAALLSMQIHFLAVIWMSLIERDLCFLFEIKTYFFLFCEFVCITFLYNTKLRPIFSFEHANTLIMRIVWINRDLLFSKKAFSFFKRTYFFSFLL